jgi:hypothetical protein
MSWALGRVLDPLCRVDHFKGLFGKQWLFTLFSLYFHHFRHFSTLKKKTVIMMDETENKRKKRVKAAKPSHLNLDSLFISTESGIKRCSQSKTESYKTR